MSALRSFSGMSDVMSVWMKPGAMAFTRMPNGPHSAAQVRVRESTPAFADAASGDRVQLERLGYYCVDPDSAPGALVLNRTATLRDTWAKVAKGGGKKGGAQPGASKKKNKQKTQKKEGA